MPKTNKPARELAVIPTICIGAGIALLVSFVCAGASAAFISSGTLGENSMSVLRLTVHFLSAALGAIASALIAAERKILCSLLADLMYIFILVAIAILLYSGVSASLALGFIMCLLGCGAAIILTNRKNRRGVRRRNKRGSR